jgi:hypothetical protein
VSSCCGQAFSDPLRRAHSRFVMKRTCTGRPDRSLIARAARTNSNGARAPRATGASRSSRPRRRETRRKQAPASSICTLRLGSCRGRSRRCPSRRRAAARRGRLPARLPRSSPDPQLPGRSAASGGPIDVSAAAR